jgi:hypothetical protein
VSANALFTSQTAYVLPTSSVPDGGVASVLSKAAVPKSRNKGNKDGNDNDDDDDDDKDDRLVKNFKF